MEPRWAVPGEREQGQDSHHMESRGTSRARSRVRFVKRETYPPLLCQPVSSHHPREWSPHHILREHQYAVGCLAWSLDDSILLTSAEQTIKLWNTKVNLLTHILLPSNNPDFVGVKTGVCFRTIDGHSDVVTALAWLPDDSGFISGSLDRKVIRWVRKPVLSTVPSSFYIIPPQDREGRQRDSWGTTAIRVTDLAVTPDFTRLVTIGMDYVPPHSVTVIDANPRASMAGSHGGEAPMGTPQSVPKKPDNRMVIYDLATKQAESCVIGFPSAGVSLSQPYNHQFHTVGR